LANIANEWSEKFNINYDASISINGGDPTRLFKEGSIIIRPNYATECLITKPLTVERVDNRGTITYPQGTYICANPTYDEYVLGLLIGEFYRTGQSIHFMNIFSFATCVDPPQISQYIFMEKIDNTLHKLAPCILKLSSETLNYILIQILHSIALYQRYKIIHGDLHDDNIFIEYLTPDTEWNHQKLWTADYYQYLLPNGTSLYIPGGREYPMLVKIGDLGISSKYSEPMMLDRNTVFDLYNTNNKGSWIPNFYTEAYDPLYITTILYRYDTSNLWIKSILMWMFNISEPTRLKSTLKRNYNRYNNRPKMEILDTLLKHVSALNILTNSMLMGKYMIPPPPGSNIIVLGKW
jgi:serine/threonine protein kinase